MNKLNIVIPMAGKGSRFTNAGYSMPKPFIDILGETMIERVINNTTPNSPDLNDYSFTIIIQKEMFNNFRHNIEGLKILYGNKLNLITVDGPQQGPAHTCLAAKHVIGTKDPLLIVNCDQITSEKDWISRYINHCVGYDGGIACVLAKDNKWSFIDISNSGVITKCVEKNPITPLATTGQYYFTRGQDFIYAAENSLKSSNRTNGEVYVSHCYQTLIDEGYKFIPFMINKFYGIGTPADLERYICVLSQR